MLTTPGICRALELLGFGDVYDMSSVFHNPHHATWWMQALRAKYENEGRFAREDWDKVLGTCQVRGIRHIKSHFHDIHRFITLLTLNFELDGL